MSALRLLQSPPLDPSLRRRQPHRRPPFPTPSTAGSLGNPRRRRLRRSITGVPSPAALLHHALSTLGVFLLPPTPDPLDLLLLHNYGGSNGGGSKFFPCGGGGWWFGRRSVRSMRGWTEFLAGLICGVAVVSAVVAKKSGRRENWLSSVLLFGFGLRQMLIRSSRRSRRNSIWRF